MPRPFGEPKERPAGPCTFCRGVGKIIVRPAIWDPKTHRMVPGVALYPCARCKEPRKIDTQISITRADRAATHATLAKS